jgi:3-hydroxyacyl-CoA dehydrogenase
MATPLASLAGVGLFAETHAGTVARRIAVVPISDAGPALASVAVIFEAVPEVLELKRDVSARASVLAGPKAIIASTTSTMTVDEMAGEVERPARVLNAHWLNPAYLVPLVELSPGVRTDGAILAKPEIATITGHSLRDVRSILDAHCLHRDRALAESGIRELEMGYAQRLAEVKAGTDSTK